MSVTVTIGSYMVYHEIQIDGTTIIFFYHDDKHLFLLFKNSNSYATKFDLVDVVMVYFLFDLSSKGFIVVIIAIIVP